MTVREAAVRLECSPNTVYQLCERGRLGHYRVGCGRGAIRITESDVAAYLASARQEPTLAPSQPPALTARIPDRIGAILARKRTRKRV